MATSVHKLIMNLLIFHVLCEQGTCLDQSPRTPTFLIATKTRKTADFPSMGFTMFMLPQSHLNDQRDTQTPHNDKVPPRIVVANRLIKDNETRH